MFCFFNLHHPDMPMLKLKLLSERNCFYLSTVFRASIRIVCFTSFFTTCLSHHLAQYMNAFPPTQAQKIIYFFFIKSLSFFFQSSFSCYILILKSDQRKLSHASLNSERVSPKICEVTRNAVERKCAEEVNQREPGLYQSGNSKNQTLQRKYPFM